MASPSSPGPGVLDLHGFDVSRETVARLETYAELLATWQRRINLVAPSTLPDVWTRHILDSLQVVRHLPDGPEARVLVDVGSGAGFPGLVIALARPAFHVKLVDSNAKKVAFLRAVIAATGAGNAEVHWGRVEELALRANVITARAVAALPKLLEMTAHLRGEGTTCLFLKGAGAEAELTAAKEGWMMRAERFESVTNAHSVLLKLSEVRRAP